MRGLPSPFSVGADLTGKALARPGRTLGGAHAVLLTMMLRISTSVKSSLSSEFGEPLVQARQAGEIIGFVFGELCLEAIGLVLEFNFEGFAALGTNNICQL